MKKLLPSDDVAEKAVIGCCMQNNKKADVLVDWFYNKNYGIIYSIIERFVDSGVKIDTITIGNELKKIGAFDDVGGYLFLSKIISGIPKSENIDGYCKIIRENYEARQLIRGLDNIIEEATTGTGIELLKSKNYDLLSGLDEHKTTEVLTAKKIMDEVCERLDRLKSGEMTGLETGLKELNRLTHGIQRKKVTYIAGYTSQGKSSLANLIARVNADKGIGVCLTSWEDSRVEILIRLISQRSGIPFHVIEEFSNIKFDTVKKRVVEGFGHYNKMTNLYIDDNPPQSLSQLEVRLAKLVDKHNVELWIVDYIQLIRPLGIKGNDNSLRAYVAEYIQGITRRLDIATIVVSQISRPNKHIADPRPTLSDLRDSGALENTAGAVILIHDYEYKNGKWKRREIEDNIRTINLAKNKSGETGSFDCVFDKPTMLFKDKEEI